MSRHASRGGFALVLLLAGCSDRPVTVTNTDGADSSNTDKCEGALEYRSVCFHAHSVEAMGYEHPLELDGEPGHELVGFGDGRVTIHRFDGDGFALIGDAEAPPTLDLTDDAVAGAFDEVPGLDLVVSKPGHYAVLYHLDEGGAPTRIGQTPFDPSTDRAFEQPVAVGPDANGRWRVVARYDDAGMPYDIDAMKDPLALWEVQGATVVELERLEIGVLGACEIYRCAGGEFNGDGRTDAVCSLENVCLDDPPENDVVHVILLAQADGTVSTAAYPTNSGRGGIATDLDGDGITDLVGDGALDTIWYRLGDGAGGLGPVTLVDPLGPPPLHWQIVSAGDLDGDGDAEVMLGHELQALVFEDAVGAPQAYEILELNGGGLKFLVDGIHVTSDVNADNIVDLPIWPRTLLVSERRQ